LNKDNPFPLFTTLPSLGLGEGYGSAEPEALVELFEVLRLRLRFWGFWVGVDGVGLLSWD